MSDDQWGIKPMPADFMPRIEAKHDDDTRNIIFRTKHAAHGKQIELGFVHTRNAQEDGVAIPLREFRLAVWQAVEHARLEVRA